MRCIAKGVFTAVSGMLALAPAAQAADDTLVVAVEPAPRATLAWAGEDEAFATISALQSALIHECPQGDVDDRLMTGLPAPEPPAMVLAGMALGGLICGRSFFRKRSKTTKEST